MAERIEKFARQRVAFGLAAVIGLLFVTGFGDLVRDVSRAHREGGLEQVCTAAWNDPLLEGVETGTEESWRQVLQANPDLLVRLCTKPVRNE